MSRSLFASVLLLASLPSQNLPDYCPAAANVVLNTDFTQITPCGGQPYNVSGGVFAFHNVTINQGVTVRGEGSRPMVWIVTGDFVVNGTLSVHGGDGGDTTTLNSANFPTPGGVGTCGGGNGGRGSPNATHRSIFGEDGFGPGQIAGGGGRGAPIKCTAGGGPFAPGGGGGSLLTFGDPEFYGYYMGGASAVQVLGFGSFGGPSSHLAGGSPGPRPFTDLRRDNDFWGATYDVARARWIAGELPLPIAGSGGGGGGDWATNNSCAVSDPAFIADVNGGGGGGGGGVIVIGALGRIVLGSTGRIVADGGAGGGGGLAGSCDPAGGGGGGSGGWIVLASRTEVEIHTHGDTFANGDSDFALSADGGVGKGSLFGTPAFLHKYQSSLSSGMLDAHGLGGFGGLGVVQLFVPPGDNSDNTNTLLDDNVKIVQNGAPLTGAQKQRYLGWRGFPDPNGLLHLDDYGVPVLLGEGVGDIRPAPLLMPLL